MSHPSLNLAHNVKLFRFSAQLRERLLARRLHPAASYDSYTSPLAITTSQSLHKYNNNNNNNNNNNCLLQLNSTVYCASLVCDKSHIYCDSTYRKLKRDEGTIAKNSNQKFS